MKKRYTYRTMLVTVETDLEALEDHSRILSSVLLLAKKGNAFGLGDEAGEQFLSRPLESFPNWDAVADDLRKRGAIVMPIYMANDGKTVALRSRPYQARGDNSQLGVIFLTRADIRGFCGTTTSRITDGTRNRVRDILRQEIGALEQRLNGDVWTYQIEDSEGRVIDSCTGLYGMETALSDAQDVIDEYLRSEGVKDEETDLPRSLLGLSRYYDRQGRAIVNKHLRDGYECWTGTGYRAVTMRQHALHTGMWTIRLGSSTMIVTLAQAEEYYGCPMAVTDVTNEIAR